MSRRKAVTNSGPAASAPQTRSRGMRRRLRRFLLRHVPLAICGAVVLLALLAVGLYFAASSSAFENMIRKRLVARIEAITGGRAEIASFHWRLLHLEAEADGVVIHGLEDPSDAPYAQIDQLRVQVALLGMLSPQVVLRDLEIVRPRLHWIVYPDGSTNQPHPRKPGRSARPAIDELFSLQASHVALERGELDYENRAAGFDVKQRYAPLDFKADDVSLALRYFAAAAGTPEFYRIETGAANLNLTRNPSRSKPAAAQGRFTATIDLQRSRILLRKLNVTARDGGQERTFQITGSLDDFRHPRWQAKATGDLDMRLLDPLTGYPDAPKGIAHLDLAASGQAQAFSLDGPVHIDGGSYIGTGVIAEGVTLDARIHADAARLQISDVVARLRQGGRIEGTVALEPWLPGVRAAVVERADANPEKRRANRNVLVRPAKVSIPVNGKVTAAFHEVSLDAILDMVAAPPYRRLGIDALMSGPTSATWSYGDANNVSVSALLGLRPSGRPPGGEAPANGIIDATYSQRSGAVDLRKLELHLPASDLVAQGSLGAYPLNRPSSLRVDFRSSNLGEFDAALRSLGLKRNGKSGAAALPVALSGQAEFHGAWTGSLIRPQLQGKLSATQLAIEMPSRPPQGEPQFMRFDSADVEGSYSPAQIAIRGARLLRGKSRIELSGTLDAQPHSKVGFGAGSMLHAHVEGGNVDLANLAPFITEGGASLPVTGEFNTQFQADGPLTNPQASGWVEFERATMFDEAVSHVHIRGAIENHVLTLASSTLEEAGGVVTATGTYDLSAKRFQVRAQAERIEVSHIDWLRRRNLDISGKLGVSVTGSGTLDDPHLEARAAIDALTIGGQQFGSLDLDARAANQHIEYKLNTQLNGAVLALNGETQLTGDYPTTAKLDFSRFDIGDVLAAAHLQAFHGQSALAGTATITGPLAHFEQLHGDASLNELSLTISGVELKGEGGAHAALANGRIRLDPVHVTGSDTDLRLKAGLTLQGSRQLDLTASGSINLKLAETLDPDLTASGTTAFQLEAHGPLEHPDLEGRVDIQNGSLSLEDIPNGLSQLRGTLQFNQNRLEVKSLTAMSGGGQLSVGGFLAYEHGIHAELSIAGNGVRIRYPQGVTSLADAKLQLQGSQNNLLLSGDVHITRFTANPNLDLAALAAQAGTIVQTVAAPDAPSNHVRLDVRIVSSPQLNFQNAFAKLAGDVDVRLRGTLASPSLLGSVSVTQGNAMIAGTRYELERGEITFTNPVRIEPNIDLSATARVEDYDITLGLNGSPQRLAVTYRSDPPLPEADVLSLLALGHTANQQRLYTQQQQEAISSSTDALLGGALNATVSSRVQKLFGAGSVKIDPNYLGAFGNSTSRITVQEQLGRNITLTYATDVNTTSQQLLQAEVAINRHVSLVVARDESGVFSMVIKATRRYR